MTAGRPTRYTPELANYICKIIATHSCGLKKLTKLYEKFPSQSSIYEWMQEYPEFAGQYLDARRFQASVLADAMLDIVDELPIYEDKEGVDRIDSGMLGRAKLDYEVLKWHASKMAPKIYGDKQLIEQTASENEQLKEELKELRAKLAEKAESEY